MNRHIPRAQMLVSSRRYADAKQELLLALAEEPEHVLGHALLGICCSALQESGEAIHHAQRAVHLAPDAAFVHESLAHVLLEADRYEEAMQSAQHALAIDPTRVQAHNVVASVYAHRKNWPQVVEATEMALAYAPDDTDARNLRAWALRSMGQSGASVEELKQSLQINAEDAHSHANLGWTYLQQGDIPKAELHFREALRIDPNLEWARVGALETLKSKVPVYRWILGYFMWMSSKTAGNQWLIVLGLFFGYRVSRALLAVSPATQFLVIPLIFVYVLFCATTWFATPLSNAFVVLHPFGRMAMTAWERWGGILIGSALLITIGLVAAATITRPNDIYVVLAICVGFTAMPLAFTFQSRQGTPRLTMAVVTAVVAVLAVGFGLGELTNVEALPTVLANFCDRSQQLFFFVPLGSILLANVLNMRS